MIETANDVAGFFSSDDFALDAVYTAPGGTAVETTVLVDEGVEIVGSDLQAVVGDTTITLQSADVPTPVHHASIVTTHPTTGAIRSYLVRDIIEDDGATVTVGAKRVS